MKKFSFNKTTTALTTLTLALTLTACGGSGGGSDSDVSSGGGISPTSSNTGSRNVTSSGAVTQFGSVYVNGVRYETQNSDIVSGDDGNVLLTNPSDVELQNVVGLGQVIIVRGTRDDNGNGVANTIIIDNELVGEVDSVDAANASFVVLGQTITITPDTIIDDSLIETVRGVEIPNDLPFGGLPETLDQLLPLGLLAEVSGFPSANGFTATRIEDADELAVGGNFEAEVKGTVSSLSATQFTLNNLTVFYDNSDLDTEDFSVINLADGQFVEVHGTVLSSTSIDASRIEREDDRFDDDFTSGSTGEFEIEGIIQSVTPDSNGTTGTVTINSVDIKVSQISSFSVGQYVEIKGSVQSDGTVTIVRIENEAEDTIRTEDIAISVSGTAFITRLGLVINPGNRTELEDDTIDGDDNLSIGDFLNNVVGNFVEARGFPLNDDVVWTEIEIDDDNDQYCRLRGPISNISGDASSFSFSIESVTIDTNQVSDNHFQGGNDLITGRAAFFAALSEGDIVQAKSDNAGAGCTDGLLVAREVEFEPADNLLYVSLNDDSNNSGFDNQLVGTISNVTTTTFDLAGATITVSDSTIIDDSIIEAAAGFEVDNEDTFGNISFTLPQLLSNGMGVEVIVSQSNDNLIAVEIEDL
jgi:hypothetical protein